MKIKHKHLDLDSLQLLCVSWSLPWHVFAFEENCWWRKENEVLIILFNLIQYLYKAEGGNKDGFRSELSWELQRILYMDNIVVLIMRENSNIKKFVKKQNLSNICTIKYIDIDLVASSSIVLTN